MDKAYQPEAWRDLYLMLGPAAAGLTGLIFVAVSLHLRDVLRDPWHRGTAGSSLLALMSVVLISGALLIPSQPVPLLGAEIAGIALVSPAYNAMGLFHPPRVNRRTALAKIVVGMAGGLLAVVAGISLAVGAGGGLWLLLPGAAIAPQLCGVERMAPDGRCRRAVRAGHRAIGSREASLGAYSAAGPRTGVGERRSRRRHDLDAVAIVSPATTSCLGPGANGRLDPCNLSALNLT